MKSAGLGWWLCAAGVAGLLALSEGSARAVTSTRSVASSFGGNGHNASFDGRLFLIRDGAGWQARLLRPEATTYHTDGLPNAQGPMWSPLALLLGPGSVNENALAICEPDAKRAPFACDAAGNVSAAGPYDCYDVMLIDSDAVTPAANGGAVMRRRHLMLWVQQPKSANASILKFTLDATTTPLQTSIRGIEPTVTADGKLMVWQGHPDNDGTIDMLMYSVNATACGVSGWSTPKSIAAMATDPAVVGKYRLADRALRAADGAVFGPTDLVHGAYPWIMPSGDAVIFTGANMPCRATEDPPGCGPRRNALSVIGYPTNWGVAHIDGDVNPATDDTVRLFFSSPGPKTFSQLPKTKGADVWPFFGSNTSNYVELVFDDGLDGRYAGFWHLNESVNKAGDLDKTRTPDVSGYFNTGVLRGGLTFAAANDGVVGKGLTFDGVDDYVEVADASSLSPVNGITIEMWIRPTASPDCDAKNNYRVVLGKGNIATGAYTVVLEENMALQARVMLGGVQRALASPALTLNTWTHVAFEYDGPTGKAAWFFGGNEVAAANLGAGTLPQSAAPLRFGGPGARAACPDGDGAFRGQLDEVAISRISRHFYVAPPPAPDGGATVDAGSGGGGGGGGGGASPPGGGGGGTDPAGGGGAGSSGSDGCGVAPGAASRGEVLLALGALALTLAAARRGAARRRPPRS
jgi:hypothetical protein